MNLKIKKLFSGICVLAILFTLQIPAQAAVVDKEEVGLTYYDSTTYLSPDYNGLTSYSSKGEGYTTPLRVQRGDLCWAYSAMASLETLMIKNGDRKLLEREDNNIHLSPLHMAFATSSTIDKESIRKDYGGGSDDISIGYFTSWRGPKAENDFPDYTATGKKIFFKKDAAAQTVVGVTGLMYLDGLNFDVNDDFNTTKRKRDTIKTVIYNYGAAVGDIFYADNKDTGYSYFYNESDVQNGCYHAVSVVGWDDNYSKSKFKQGNQPKSNGAWLCKDSNVTSKMSGKYLWISYEDRFLFRKNATEISKEIGGGYAFVGYHEIDDNVKLYQNTTKCPDIELELGATYVNVFDIDDDYNLLDKITFETTYQGARYSLYYVPLDSSSVPNPDKSTWTELCSGTTGYCGYICADIDNFKVNKSDKKFAIGIKFNESSTKIGTYESDNSEAKIGKSYVIFDDGNISGADRKVLNEQGLSQVNNINNVYNSNPFVIKAVATKAPEEPSTEPEIIKGDVDGDGSVTINDVTMIQRALAEYITLDAAQLKAADVNGDGFVNIKDATKIQRVLAEFETLD